MLKTSSNVTPVIFALDPSIIPLSDENFYVCLFIRDMIKKHGVCVQVLGDLTLLPVELQQSIARIVKLSRENTRLNFLKYVHI